MEEEKSVKVDNHQPLDERNGLSKSNLSLEDNPYFSATFRKKKLPEWLDHFNSRDLKELFKCSVAAWVATLLIFINPTLRVLGQSALFAPFVQFIVPPSGIILVQIMAASTIALGCCLAWAWGVITMKAALATRPAAELNARLAQLQQLGSQNSTYVQQASGQTTYTQIAIYDGFMLDTRVTVTYFCMLGLFIYFMARLRVAAPKAALISLFAMIVSDIFLSIAPLLPTFSGTIPQTLLIPTGCSVAIGFVCNILFFPRSTSHVVLDNMSQTLDPLNAFLQSLMINLKDPTKRFRLVHLKKIKMKVIEAYKAHEAAAKLLPMDVSMGRWGAGDVKSLQGPIRQTLISFLALLQFQISREKELVSCEDLEKHAQSLLDDAKATKSQQLVGKHQIGRSLDFRSQIQSADLKQHFINSLKSLSVSSEDLIDSCIQAISAISEGLTQSNTRRWFGRLSKSQCEQLFQRHSNSLDLLQRNRTKFTEASYQGLLKTHPEVFDEEGNAQKGHPGHLAALVFGMLLADKISKYAETVEILLQRVVELEEQRVKPRLWLPLSLKKIVPWALDKDTVAPGTLARTFTSDQPDEAKSKPSRRKQRKEKKKQKNAEDNVESSAKAQLAAMAGSGGRQRNKFGQFLAGFYHWLINSEGLFAIRVVVATLAVAIPAVIPSTAGFFYREKGLWVLIMAQTGLVEFTADFVFGLIIRVIGTVLGGVLGLAVWYIGAGNGPGNPYGMAAITAVAVVCFMWLRLFTSPAMLQGVILMVATLFLVVTYSWNDTHIPTYGNPGVGYTVFWRRLLLVLIGMGAGAIVLFIPRPPSANRHYRYLLSKTLQNIQHRYILFGSSLSTSSAPPKDLQKVAEKHAIDTAEVLLEIDGPIKLTRFEFSSSPYDAQTLSRICDLYMDLNLTVTRLLLYAADPQLQGRFLLVSGAKDEHFFADLMTVLTLLQQVLKTGEPLPAILPVPLLAVSHSRVVDREHYDNAGMDQLDAEFAITKQSVTDPAFRQYCEALGAFVQLTRTVDQLVMAVKSAVGETGSSASLAFNQGAPRSDHDRSMDADLEARKTEG